MKKHLFYASLFLAALSSCSKDDDRVSAPAGEVNKDLEMIQLSVANNENFSIETRGTGMVGGLTQATNIWKGQDIYVLMTDSGTVSPVEPDYKYQGLGKYILNNVKVTAPNGVTSGLVTGKPESNDEIGHHYYYPIKGLFDFYGYHVDDAVTGAPTLNADADSTKMTLNVQIDGSQDLMVAKADFNADANLTAHPELADYYYSAYAARREVQPMLNFKHLLAQLQFEVINAGEHDSLFVDSIGIKSVYKGTMTVAGKNHGNIDWSRAEGDTTMLFVKVDYNDEDVVLDSLKAVKLEKDAQNYTKIGNLLVPASKLDTLITTYEGEIRLVQTLPVTVVKNNVIEDDTVTATSTIPFKISLPQTAGSLNFAAGHAYTIKIKVYGLSQIGITANLTQWSNGGEFVLTPEDQVITQEEAIFTASTIQKAWVVKDQASYANVPEYYRENLQWGVNGLDGSLPWLLVAFTPNADETITFSVKNEGTGETRNYTWPKRATSSFFTIKNAELNEGFEGEEVWEMTPGSKWTITVNGETVTLTI